jgi:hypothetical protein
MTDNVRYIRDYKRREEREAADVRLAKRVMGLTSVSVPPGIVDYELSVTWAGTAPSEMPPVWPSYQAPESDPA